MVSTETHFRSKNTQATGEMIGNATGSKESRVPQIHYRKQTKFEQKLLQKTKIIHQEDIIVVNEYIPNTRVYKYIKQTSAELKKKREIDSNIVIIRNSYNPMFNYGQDNQTKCQSEIKRLEAQDKPNRHIQKTPAEYTFFPSAQEAFFDTNQMVTIKKS